MLFLGILPKKVLYEWCKQFSHNHHAEILELLTVYEIVMTLGESYFVPSLLPNTLSYVPIDKSSVSFSIEPVTGVVDEELLDDYQSSGDDDDDPGYIIILANRLPKDSLLKNSIPEPYHSSDETKIEESNAYLTVYHDTLPTCNNFYNVNLLNSVSFEESTDLLSPYSACNDYQTTFITKKPDGTFYPSLCRIWLSPFIPDGFWPRLLHMIVSDREIHEVMVKLLPTSQSSDQYSLWSLWQSGVAVVHQKITWLELKQEVNYKLDYEKLVSQHKNSRIFLSISTSKFVELHKNSPNTDCHFSGDTVLKLCTKLLVLIEQLILELEEWFPRTFTFAGRSGEVESYIPCYQCTHGGKEMTQFTYTDCVVLYDNDLQKEIICFSFEQLLQLYSRSESPVCQNHGKLLIELCAPDVVSTLCGKLNNNACCLFT